MKEIIINTNNKEDYFENNSTDNFTKQELLEKLNKTKNLNGYEIKVLLDFFKEM